MGGGGGGGGNISDYVLLVVPYTSRGSGGMPPRKFVAFLCSETAFSTIFCLTVVYRLA